MEPQPISGVLRHGRWTIETFERVGDPPAAIDWLAVPVGTDRLRVAVLDGRALVTSGRTAASGDPARTAVALVRAALAEPVAAPTALARINAILHEGATTFGPSRPSTTAVFAELLPDGRIVLARAGGGTAFVRFGSTWTATFAPDPLRPEAAAAMAEWATSNPGASAVDRLLAEELRAGLGSAWRSTPVGRFPEVRTERARADGADELVLATEGGRLDIERVVDLARWTAGIREFERGRARELGRSGRRVHPPIAILRVTAQPIIGPRGR